MADPLRTATSTTTVKQIDEAIAIWNKVSGSNSAQTNIKRLQESRQKVIGILQHEYNAIYGKNLSDFKGTDAKIKTATRNQYKLALIDLMRDNYKTLSLSEINRIKTAFLNNAEQHTKQEIESNMIIDNAIDFLEGKKGITLASVVKTSISTAAIALMSQAGGFSLLSTVATALWTFNPVIAVCAGVIGAVALGKLIGKVFGPELKALKNEYKMYKALDQTEDSSFDTKKIIEESDKNEKENSEVEAQDNKLKTDIAGFKPKSIDEVVSFMGQFDKLPEADIVAAVKAAPSINFEKLFKVEAAGLVMADDKDDLAKITELRTKFGSFLSAADMDKFQKDTGLKLNDKDYSQEFEDYESVKGGLKTYNYGPNDKRNYQAGKNAFDKFKADYSVVITNIFAGKDTKDVMKGIANLENFANDPNNFSKESQNVRDKMKKLCNKMIEMLKEITKAKIMGATDKDAAMKNVSKEHNLDENALGDLLK